MELSQIGHLATQALSVNNMETISYVGSAEGLMEYLEQEASLSNCCGAIISNSRCSDCKENV